jgi:hypothetical protein
MKKLLLISAVLTGLWFKTFAQDKVEQFCQMNLKQKVPFSSKYKAQIIYGSTGLIISSNQPKVEKDFDTVPDALNYLGVLGWKLFSTQRIGEGYPEWDMIFKKEIIQVENKAAAVDEDVSKSNNQPIGTCLQAILKHD